MDFKAQLQEIKNRNIHNKNYTLTIEIYTSINNDYTSYNHLSELFHKINDTHYNSLVIDIYPSAFIAANQFAALGCIIESFIKPEKKISLGPHISPIHLNLIKRNGFGKLFSLDSIPDINNTVIQYKNFDVKHINEYDAYLTLELFNRSDLPQMSVLVTDNIRGYLLEIFQNVIDHTTSTKVYTCGQFFPKNSLLYFSIVDTGETIQYNVYRYHQKHSLSLPANTLKWALEKGNTTLDDNIPRGIGLYLIKEFVNLNQGYFYIVSGNETYEINPKYGERYKCMEHTFPGTIVTIAINLDDKASYYMADENILF